VLISYEPDVEFERHCGVEIDPETRSGNNRTGGLCCAQPDSPRSSAPEALSTVAEDRQVLDREKSQSVSVYAS
jgi:hypothetical protein